MSGRGRYVSLFILALTATSALGQLTAPSVSRIAITNGDVGVTGTPVSGAAAYEAEALVNGTRVAVSTSQQSTVIIPAASLPPNTQVTIKLRAVDAQGTKSAPSAPAATVTAPTAPTGVGGIPGPNRITVSWQPAAGATSYRLTLSNGMSFTTASTSFVVTGLPTATTFNCLVWALNAAGAQGPASAVVAVKTANIAMD